MKSLDRSVSFYSQVLGFHLALAAEALQPIPDESWSPDRILEALKGMAVSMRMDCQCLAPYAICRLNY